MKKTNGLKITLIISIVILLSLIAFVGIYVKKQNAYKNIIPEYKLGIDLGEKRVITIAPATGTSTSVYDESGNKVETIPDDADETKYTTETKEINKSEVLTEQNYEKAKKIIEKRLDNLKAEGYTIRLEKSNGEMVIEFPENEQTSKYENVLTATGMFEIVSKDKREVLMSNDDIKKAKVAYGSSDNGTTVYLTIELNKEGTKKLKEISNNYRNTVTKDQETGEEKTIEKQVTLRLDWPNDSIGNLEYKDLFSQAFTEENASGTLSLSIGKATKDNEELQNNYNQASQIASALNSGILDVKYTETGSKVIHSEVTNNQIMLGIGCATVAYIAVLFVIIIKYKKLGLLGAISNIGMLAITVIFVKLAKVIITFGAFTAGIGIIIANTCIIVKLINKVLTSESAKSGIWKGVLEAIDILVCLLAISVTSIFMYSEVIVSAGMVMFWGIISIIISNLLFTKTLLLNAKQE